MNIELKETKNTAIVRKIPFFNYPHVYMQYEEELKDIMLGIASRGAYIMQKELTDFEKKLANFLGANHSIGVANCTDGLLLALMAAGVKKGDEVIFCSHTFVATASAIHFSGATPVPVECGKDHLIDPKAIEAAITPKTKVIMPTQLNGLMCDMDAIQAIATEYNLLIIEDAAQSLGATYKGKHGGTFGIASSFSFYPAKVVGCFGDGGGVVTNDIAFDEKIRMLRDHGRLGSTEIKMWGMNSRLDNLQAGILDFKLSKYHLDIDRRRELATLYNTGLKEVKELVLPPAPNSRPERFEVFQNYEIESDNREELRSFLKENGIGTILQWGGKAVHQFEALGLNYHLPFTESVMERAFLLPMNTSLANEDIFFICSKIREFYGYTV